MKAEIRILDDATINQIAAGEVIENPASVVKELVENAVDAGASKLIIEIQGGGFQEIRLSDDGKGMHKDDLELSLTRHATSKIRVAKDLETALTMGFRGEALASIAAVSKVEMITCVDDNGLGHLLFAEGGKIKKTEEAARNKGTTITIRSLFYNVPARQKFQKSPRASQTQIVKMLTELALAHPELELKCVADGRPVFSSFLKRSEEKETMQREVFEKVLGGPFLDGSFAVKHEANGCSVFGFVGAPHQTRKNRSGQFLIVNGRAVFSPPIMRAIYDGYGTRLPSNEHPTFALHLQLPPEWIDVNVHPQKKEIRLREAPLVIAIVRQAVFQALQGEVPTEQEKPKLHDWLAPVDSKLVFREEESSEPPPEPRLSFIELPIIGLFDHYLLLDREQMDLSLPGSSDGIVLIDLKAARARLTFEAFLSRLDGKGELQTLMFPISLEFSKYEAEKVMLHLGELEKLGLAIRPFGNETFLIDALDPHLDQDQIAPFIHEMIEVIESHGDQKKLALHASRFARSQKEAFTLHEARAVMQQLFKTDAPFQSPTGKPTCVILGRDDIKKYFR